MYLDLIGNIIGPILADIIENDDHLQFQQDGALPHFDVKFLDARFLGHWIIRGSFE